MKLNLTTIALILLLIFTTIISCEKKNESKNAEETKLNSVMEKLEENAKNEKVETDETVEDKNVFDILIPRSYRDFDKENPVNDLSKNWSELYKQNNKYFIGKADYNIEKGFDECSGNSTKTITPKKDAILFLNNPNLKNGEIKFLSIGKKRIWPNEKVSFKFNNTEYLIRAEGKVLSTENVYTDGDKLEKYQKVENYKLFISTKDSKEQLFLTEKSFNDTFVELLFVGDIDNDGKLDFIFGANRDYEEERVVLYLSSQAEKGQIIKRVSEIAVQFDC
jgi:hypothetical protein